MMLLIVSATLILSFFITSFVRRTAIKRNQFDIPNERSSHNQPTPRGAGLAVVIAFTFGLIVLLIRGDLKPEIFVAIFLPGLLVAIVGYLDDLGKVTAARIRLLAHIVAGLIAVYILGGLPPMPIFGETLNLGLLGNLIAVIYLVWLLNLFNFMDGIDSITGIETLSSCVIISVLLINRTAGDQWQMPMLLASAVLGFLYFNWPPAKIFLGDIGSGYIGFTVGTMSLVIAKTEPLFTWAWIILLGVFIVDATVTLIRRLITRQRVYLAHRSHAYQHLATNSSQHLKVSLGIAAINIFWLAPIAWLVVDQQVQPIIGVAVAYAPLVVIAIYFKAGKPTN